MGRCRHRHAGGHGARRGRRRQGCPEHRGPRGVRPGDNRGFFGQDPYNLGRCRHRRAGGRGAGGVGGVRVARGAGDTRCPSRRQSGFFGQDPYNVGRCRHRHAGGGAPAESVAPGWPRRGRYAVPAQATIGVSRTRFHETWDGADIDTPAGVASGGVSDARVARSAGDDAVRTQATNGVSRTRSYETWDGADIDAPAGVQPAPQPWSASRPKPTGGGGDIPTGWRARSMDAPRPAARSPAATGPGWCSRPRRSAPPRRARWPGSAGCRGR